MTLLFVIWESRAICPRKRNLEKCARCPIVAICKL
jgi:hypothetical protein